MKRAAFVLILITVLFVSIAVHADSYGFPEALEDAEIVWRYFNSTISGTEAEASFNRLYEFWYKDAKDFVINKNTGKFHIPICTSVTEQMHKDHKVFITCSVGLLLTFGFSPCGNCHPDQK